MDRRIIKPIPAGVHTVPGNQCIAYSQDGVPVYDYMDEVPTASLKDAAADVPEALMISVYDGEKMVYAKEPPEGFVFVHHFAGTEVVGAVDAVDVIVDPLPVGTGALNPVEALPGK